MQCNLSQYDQRQLSDAVFPITQVEKNLYWQDISSVLVPTGRTEIYVNQNNFVRSTVDSNTIINNNNILLTCASQLKAIGNSTPRDGNKRLQQLTTNADNQWIMLSTAAADQQTAIQHLNFIKHEWTMDYSNFARYGA
jgi:hypothetical protein